MLVLSRGSSERGGTDNGGTRVVPGSHRWDDERAPKVEEAVPTEMAAGSALVWLGSTYHGGGDNTADSPRTGLCYALDSGNVRQEENQYLAVPPETLRRYPEEIQRLLGYDIAPPFCGYVDMNDPLAAITGERRELSQVGQLYAE